MRTASAVSSALCLLATLSAFAGVVRLANGGGNALYERAMELRAINERKHVAWRGNDSGRSPADVVVRGSVGIVGR